MSVAVSGDAELLGGLARGAEERVRCRLRKAPRWEPLVPLQMMFVETVGQRTHHPQLGMSPGVAVAVLGPQNIFRDPFAAISDVERRRQFGGVETGGSQHWKAG